MKKIFFSVMFMLAALTMSAQQTIQSENVEAFHAVTLSGSVAVELIPGETNKIDIILTDVDINKFKWSVKNGVLNAQLSSGPKGAGHAEIKIHYAGTLQSVSISGGEIITKEPIEATIFRFSASSGAKATMDFEVTDLEVSVSGNSVAQLNGEVKYLYMHATEKSKVDAREMEALSAEVDAATGAEAYVLVEERLVANARTASTIFYKGKPSVMKDKTSKMNAGMMGSSVLYIGD